MNNENRAFTPLEILKNKLLAGQNINKYSKFPTGFTLIELLVVIAIIGILATIVLVSLNTARAKARDARRSTDIHQIALAMEMYYYNQKPASYPVALPTNDTTVIPSGSTLLAPFMGVAPIDPLNRDNFFYYWTNCGDATKRYCAWAVLESVPGTYTVANPRGETRITTQPTCNPAPGPACWDL